jgi:hypothetical protein
MLTVPCALLEESFRQLRAHGQGQIECIVYWLALVDAVDRVDQVVHPVHSGSVAHYDVDSAWMTRFWFDLAERRKKVVAQVHTHPGAAFHSGRDDDLALISTVGFLSLVLPRFALGPVTLDGACLAVRKPEGDWQTVPPKTLLRIEP